MSVYQQKRGLNLVNFFPLFWKQNYYVCVCKKYQIYISLTVCSYCENTHASQGYCWMWAEFFDLFMMIRRNITLDIFIQEVKDCWNFYWRPTIFYTWRRRRRQRWSSEKQKLQARKHKKKISAQLIEHCSWACLFIFKYIMTIKRSTIHSSS